MTFYSASEELKQKKPSIKIFEFESSSATVEEAANVLKTEPARIAKTLAFKVGNEAILIVAAGDTKIDNAAFKRTFGVKAKMLTADEVTNITSHPIGGVTPFGLAQKCAVYIDESINRFKTVFPACGSTNSATELTPNEFLTFIEGAKKVDVCKGWRIEVH